LALILPQGNSFKSNLGLSTDTEVFSNPSWKNPKPRECRYYSYSNSVSSRLENAATASSYRSLKLWLFPWQLRSHGFYMNSRSHSSLTPSPPPKAAAYRDSRAVLGNLPEHRRLYTTLPEISMARRTTVLIRFSHKTAFAKREGSHAKPD
jgi:hypothetical protein